MMRLLLPLLSMGLLSDCHTEEDAIASGSSLPSFVPCVVPPTNDGTFNRLSPVSKYLSFLSSTSKFSYQGYDATESVCNNAGLEIAEVTNTLDLVALNWFIDAGSSYWIGMNDKNGTGFFTDAKGRAVIFQAFGIGEPSGPGCVLVFRQGSRIRMKIAPCNSKGGILCQFKEKSCNVQPSTGLKNEFGEFVKIGTNPTLYVSTVQKQFQDALSSCTNIQKVLLSIRGLKSGVKLTSDIRNFVIENGLDPETQFWSSGKLQGNAEGNSNGRVTWEPTQDPYNLKVIPGGVNLQWEEGEPKEIIGKSSQDACVDLIFDSDTKPPIWQASSCFLPKFYVCMDPNNSTTEARNEETNLILERLENIANETVFEGKFVKNIMNANATLSSSNISNSKNSTTIMPLTNLEFDEVMPPPPVTTCPPKPVKIIDPIKINLTQPLSINETLGITLYMGKNLVKNGNVKVKVGQELAFKRDIIDTIFGIFKKAVAHEFVSHDFLNIAREMNILYQSSVNKSKKGEESVDAAGWEKVLEVLDNCLMSIPPYTFFTKGLLLNSFESFNGGREVLITLLEEGDNLNLDYLIDIMWWVYSFSLGACYPSGAGYDPITWISNYYNLFTLDFMDKVMDKWTNEDGANTLKAGLIFGDVDFVVAMTNLRKAAISGYIQNSIQDRIVARPISSR